MYVFCFWGGDSIVVLTSFITGRFTADADLEAEGYLFLSMMLFGELSGLEDDDGRRERKACMAR